MGDEQPHLSEAYMLTLGHFDAGEDSVQKCTWAPTLTRAAASKTHFATLLTITSHINHF